LVKHLEHAKQQPTNHAPNAQTGLCHNA